MEDKVQGGSQEYKHWNLKNLTIIEGIQWMLRMGVYDWPKPTSREQGLQFHLSQIWAVWPSSLPLRWCYLHPDVRVGVILGHATDPLALGLQLDWDSVSVPYLLGGSYVTQPYLRVNISPLWSCPSQSALFSHDLVQHPALSGYLWMNEICGALRTLRFS